MTQTKIELIEDLITAMKRLENWTYTISNIAHELEDKFKNKQKEGG